MIKDRCFNDLQMFGLDLSGCNIRENQGLCSWPDIRLRFEP
jgi:hypothetical protein